MSVPYGIEPFSDLITLLKGSTILLEHARALERHSTSHFSSSSNESCNFSFVNQEVKRGR